MYPAIVFLPLRGALIAGCSAALSRRRARHDHHDVALFVWLALSWPIFDFGRRRRRSRRRAVHLDHPCRRLQVDWALRIDTLTAVMLVVVTTVSFLVHLYSIGYMDEDPHRRASSPICRSSPSRC
jgi:NADH-quinone oxidoreductase subunit L